MPCGLSSLSAASWSNQKRMSSVSKVSPSLQRRPSRRRMVYTEASALGSYEANTLGSSVSPFTGMVRPPLAHVLVVDPAGIAGNHQGAAVDADLMRGGR